MRFDAYVVELKHSESNFTGNLLIAGSTVSANFKKVDGDIYVVQFPNQVAFSLLEKVPFKSKDNEILVLLPLLSKYNKRKLTKVARLLAPPEAREKHVVLSNLTAIDKFVKIAELLDFFSMSREEAVAVLLDRELRKEIKLIDFEYLTVTSFENYQKYLNQMHAIFTEYYTGRHQSLKFSEIESKIKLPQDSLFFQYMVRGFTDDFSFTVKKDKVVFKKLTLSENQKVSLSEISDLLKKNKLSIFTVDNILKLSGISYKEVNDAMWVLLEIGDVVQLNERYFIFTNELNKLLNKLKKYKRNQGELIDIQTFRELTLYTRKYIIVLFEYFDSQMITSRVENHRKILLGA